MDRIAGAEMYRAERGDEMRERKTVDMMFVVV